MLPRLPPLSHIFSRVDIRARSRKRVPRDAASGGRQRDARTKSGEVVERGWRIRDRARGVEGEKEEERFYSNYVRESIKRANT